MRLALVIAAVLALAIGASQAVARVAGPSNLSTPIEKGAADCGNPTGNKQIGTVKYSRDKGTLRIEVSLKGGTPNAEYVPTLWRPFFIIFPCIPVTTLGKFKTDSGGNGGRVYTVDEPRGEYFVDVFESGVTDGDNDSTLVTI